MKFGIVVLAQFAFALSSFAGPISARQVARDGLSLCYRLDQYRCGADTNVCQWIYLPATPDQPYQPARPARPEETGCRPRQSYVEMRIRQGEWGQLEGITNMQCRVAERQTATDRIHFCEGVMGSMCEWITIPAQPAMPEQQFIPGSPAIQGCYPRPELAAEFGLQLPPGF